MTRITGGRVKIIAIKNACYSYYFLMIS